MVTKITREYNAMELTAHPTSDKFLQSLYALEMTMLPHEHSQKTSS